MTQPQQRAFGMGAQPMCPTIFVMELVAVVVAHTTVTLSPSNLGTWLQQPGTRLSGVKPMQTSFTLPGRPTTPVSVGLPGLPGFALSPFFDGLPPGAAGAILRLLSSVVVTATQGAPLSTVIVGGVGGRGGATTCTVLLESPLVRSTARSCGLVFASSASSIARVWAVYKSSNALCPETKSVGETVNGDVATRKRLSSSDAYSSRSLNEVGRRLLHRHHLGPEAGTR